MDQDHNLSPKILDLLKCLSYAAYEEYQTPPEGYLANKKYKGYRGYRFQIHGPEDIFKWLVTLLVGDPINDKGIPGNPSFLENDLKLVAEMSKEMQEAGRTKDSILDEYVQYAQARNTSTQDESIRERLEKAFSHYSKTVKSDNKMLATGYDEITSPVSIQTLISDHGGYDLGFSDLEIIRPWIEENRDELIKILDL